MQAKPNEPIRQRILAEQFQPFEIEMTDGRHIRFQERVSVAVDPNGRGFMYFDDAEVLQFEDATKIVSIRDLEASTKPLA